MLKGQFDQPWGFETRASQLVQKVVREQAASRVQLELAAATPEKRRAWERARDECVGANVLVPARPGDEAGPGAPKYPLFVRELYSEDYEMDVVKVVRDDRSEASAAGKSGKTLLKMLQDDGLVPPGAKGPLRRKRALGLLQVIDDTPVLHCVVITAEARRRPGVVDEKFMCASWTIRATQTRGVACLF